jgi:hypothetical protein
MTSKDSSELPSEISKAELFWLRLNLASGILDYANKRRHLRTLGLLPDSSNLDAEDFIPIFRTYYAKLIWDIMATYPILKKTTFIALNDAEKFKFDRVSSIDDADDSPRLGKTSHYSKLKRTRLLKHIYHVVWVASLLKDKAGGNIQGLLLLALFHDFGKNEEVKGAHKSAIFRSHEEISSNYARSIMSSTGDFTSEYVETICSIIATHHKLPQRGVLLYDLLNMADGSARELEGAIA